MINLKPKCQHSKPWSCFQVVPFVWTWHFRDAFEGISSDLAQMLTLTQGWTDYIFVAGCQRQNSHHTILQKYFAFIQSHLIRGEGEDYWIAPLCCWVVACGRIQNSLLLRSIIGIWSIVLLDKLTGSAGIEPFDGTFRSILHFILKRPPPCCHCWLLALVYLLLLLLFNHQV